MKKDSMLSLIFAGELLKGKGSGRRSKAPSERPKNMYDIKTTRQKIFAFVKIISYDSEVVYYVHNRLKDFNKMLVRNQKWRI
jgi:hypothetical protein